MIILKFYEILNSQGEFVVESAVIFSKTKRIITTSVPTGSSTSTKEPTTLPAKTSIRNIHKYQLHNIFMNALKKRIPPNLFDQLLIQTDKSPRRRVIGGNTILLLSVTYAKAFSVLTKQPLFEVISKLYNTPQFVSAPNNILLLFNLINGGAHANTQLTIQEFKIGFPRLNLHAQISRAQKFWIQLVRIAKKHRLCTGVGKEGGITPNIPPIQALKLIDQTAQKLDLRPHEDYVIYIDAAANDFYEEASYHLYKNKPPLSPTQLRDEYIKWTQSYPIVGIEDPFAEQDNQGWSLAPQLINEGIIVTGDDLTSTNAFYIDKFASTKQINNVIIKPNQAGTILETVQAIQQAYNSRIGITISHRSKETNDPFLSHLIWAAFPNRIKVGNIVRGERVAKFNELLRIEQGIYSL